MKPGAATEPKPEPAIGHGWSPPSHDTELETFMASVKRYGRVESLVAARLSRSRCRKRCTSRSWSTWNVR